MGTFRQNPQLKPTLFLFGVFLLVSTTFNNCGQAPPQDSVVNQTFEKRVGDTKAIYQNSLDESFCADSSNYSCSRKVYSPHISSETRMLKDLCFPMKDGTVLCPTGLELRYNTQSAIEICGANCPEDFDYEDAQCSLVLPNILGENPINEAGRNLKEALLKVHEGCKQALGKEPL